jgi:hypothetical protein
MTEYEQLGQEISKNIQVAVGASVVVVSEARTRKVIYIRNTSTGGQVIYVAFSNETQASATNGIVLNPGEYTIDSTSGGEYAAWTGKITALASVAGGTLNVFER